MSAQLAKASFQQACADAGTIGPHKYHLSSAFPESLLESQMHTGPEVSGMLLAV